MKVLLEVECHMRGRGAGSVKRSCTWRRTPNDPTRPTRDRYVADGHPRRLLISWYRGDLSLPIQRNLERRLAHARLRS